MGVPLHAGFDIAIEDASRSQTTSGGALMGLVEYIEHAKLDLVGIEYTRVATPTMEPAWF